jgi:hypothetical protein
VIKRIELVEDVDIKMMSLICDGKSYGRHGFVKIDKHVPQDYMLCGGTRLYVKKD